MHCIETISILLPLLIITAIPLVLVVIIRYSISYCKMCIIVAFAADLTYIICVPVLYSSPLCA